MKIVKISDDILAQIGATVAEFPDKLTALIAENSQLKTMADKAPDVSALEARIKTLETQIAALTPGVTEARVKELVTAEVPAITTSATAAASRIVTDALAAVGTNPAKPTPANADANETPEAKGKALIAAGKFEEAYAIDPAIRKEFGSAKSFAAYSRANARGGVAIRTK